MEKKKNVFFWRIRGKQGEMNSRFKMNYPPISVGDAQRTTQGAMPKNQLFKEPHT
jgi:hypothetical protein